MYLLFKGDYVLLDTIMERSIHKNDTIVGQNDLFQPKFKTNERVVLYTVERRRAIPHQAVVLRVNLSGTYDIRVNDNKNEKEEFVLRMVDEDELHKINKYSVDSEETNNQNKIVNNNNGYNSTRPAPVLAVAIDSPKSTNNTTNIRGELVEGERVAYRFPGDQRWRLG